MSEKRNERFTRLFFPDDIDKATLGDFVEVGKVRVDSFFLRGPLANAPAGARPKAKFVALVDFLASLIVTYTDVDTQAPLCFRLVEETAVFLNREEREKQLGQFAYLLKNFDAQSSAYGSRVKVSHIPRQLQTEFEQGYLQDNYHIDEFVPIVAFYIVNRIQKGRWAAYWWHLSKTVIESQGARGREVADLMRAGAEPLYRRLLDENSTSNA